ncbi:redox-sensing transcriptional repressor Rex [bacterium]|nr:redox-sensing transcriptional repressor Rex [bacterium]
MEHHLISEKTVERLILYRRILLTIDPEKQKNIVSHQLALLTGVKSPQVRRDLMVIGYSGSPARGYDISSLIESIGHFIDAPVKQGIALAGVGNIGRAIIDYFKGRRPKLDISAIFDIDPEKINRVLHGCRCYHIDQMEAIIRAGKIHMGIITVPADSAQSVAEHMIRAGVTGILNYAPVKLVHPENIHVENRDITLVIEKVAYFSRQVR